MIKEGSQNRDLRVLAEVRELFFKIKEHQKIINQENYRIEHVNKLVLAKKEEEHELQENKNSLLTKLNSLENKLAEEEKELNQAESHILEVTNQKQQEALEKEISALKPTVDNLQEEALSLMEELENIDVKIKEAQEFIKNSKDTLEEIEAEVNNKVTEEENIIKSYEEEKKELLSVFSDGGKELYLATEKKFSTAKDPDFFTNLVGMNCHKCGSLVDSEHRQLIDKQDSLVSCPGCRRLFLL